MNDDRVSVLNLIFPILFLCILMVIPLIEYQEILSYSILSPIIVSAGIIIYPILWTFLKPNRFSRNGGLFIGFLFILNIFLEDFINWPTKTSALVSTLAMMFLIFISFSIISAITPGEKYNLLIGIKSSFTSALLGVIIALCFGFLICYLFPGRIVEILRNDPGFTDFSNSTAYTFYNAFDNASSHIIVVPVVSIIMGSIGAVIKLLTLKLKK
jgi:hypothetical protein